MTRLRLAFGLEEFVDCSHELLGTHPDERVVGVIDDDQLRTPDPVVERFCVVERYRGVVRSSDDDV